MQIFSTDSYNFHPFYLYDVTTSSAAVHVLVVLRDLNTVDDPFELAKVAVCGRDLSRLHVQLPHSQCQTNSVDVNINS